VNTLTLVSHLAIFFIIWWVVLFATLPFGLRTQDEDGDVTPGTTASAPRGPHMTRALIRTTFVALVVFGAFWLVTDVLGYDFDDIPRIVPRFD
jgi:predicted secreted protein